MKIVVLHESPILCARGYSDQELEINTIAAVEHLATAHRLLDGSRGTLLRPHSRIWAIPYDWVLPDEEGKNPIIPLACWTEEPWSEFARQDSGTYNWLFSLYLACCREWAFRKQSSHGTSRWIPHLRELPYNIFRLHPSWDAFNAPDVTPEQVEEGRRWFLEKIKKPTWTRRTRPEWVAKSLPVMTRDPGHMTGSRQLTLI